MTQSIADAIAQAKAAAAESVSAGALSTQSTTTAVSNHVAASSGPLGVDDMLSAGVAVDHWLKLTEDGIKIGDKTKAQDELEVFLDLSEVAYCYQIKYQLNGKAVYHRSYDRQYENGTGKSWMECLAEAKRINPDAYEYRSAEIPLVLATEFKDKEGNVVVAAGDRLGLTLSTTGWKPFEGFLRDLKRRGVDISADAVKLTLGYKRMTKTGVSPWGIPQFLAFEQIDQMPIFDTVH